MRRAILRTFFRPRIFSWILTKMSFALPAHRLRETTTLVAFRHPNPSYPFHALLVPKKPISSLGNLDPVADGDLISDVISTAQGLVTEFGLPAYRLIVNGGEYQDFPYLHFHLISDAA
jgi:diadenosine tetraphosphate (Ap4A) HIT family hydrolase